MAVDGRGLHMTGSAEAVTRYDRALDHLVRFQPEVVEVIAAAAAEDRGCVLAHLLGAYLALMSTEEGALAAAREALARADDASEDSLWPRERAHRTAARRPRPASRRVRGRGAGVARRHRAAVAAAAGGDLGRLSRLASG
jgi:hypothetical protein